MPDGWDGVVLPGGFRGYPLTICLVHGGWWTIERPCPACGMVERVAEPEGR